MIVRRLAFLTARLAAAIVFVLTWVYGVVALSPFAFDMFVKPRLFPWLETFAVWHHLFFAGAYLLTVLTLVPVLMRGRRGARADQMAWWASVTYIGVLGAAAASVMSAPRLSLIDAGTRDLFIVPGALVPLVWLAAIDHLVGWHAVSASSAVTSQRRLLATCLGTAAVLWLCQSLRAGIVSSGDLPWRVSLISGAWSLSLTSMLFVVLYLFLVLIAACAATRQRSVAWEYGLTLLLVMALVCEFFRHLVFPSLMLQPFDAAFTAAPFALAVVTAVAGWRLGATRPPVGTTSAVDALLSIRGDGMARRVVLMSVLIATMVAQTVVEPIDWAMTLTRLLAIVQAAVVFGVLLDLTRRLQDGAWSFRWLVVPVVAVLLAHHAAPLAARAMVAATHDGRADPHRLLDRYASTDPLTGLAARAFMSGRQSDNGFFSRLLELETRLSAMTPAAAGRFGSLRTSARVAARPHVFVFVIDSLRRDYLQPYNQRATFTPAIAHWARDAYVFRNAFTWYGGTWLSMPSLWTGGTVTRRWASVLSDANRLEDLIVAEGYDFIINDYTIAQALRPATRRTFLDPSVPSPAVRLCQNVESLQAHLASRTGSDPIFGFFAPMDVHILNTAKASDVKEPGSDGFYVPYSSRLARVDECFGSFIRLLETSGLYDDSIVILTSDHGDSLGEEGRWGHQFFLYPEDVRIPLIVQLPRTMRSQVTTDLAEVSFLPDVTPTLYQLLGHRIDPAREGFGAPLFVPADSTRPSRRRQSVLLMSSYGSSYAMLRRNGRLLYLADIVNRREAAFTLFDEPLGARTMIGESLRRVNQRKLLDGLAQVEALHRTPGRTVAAPPAGIAAVPQSGS